MSGLFFGKWYLSSYKLKSQDDIISFSIMVTVAHCKQKFKSWKIVIEL